MDEAQLEIDEKEAKMRSTDVGEDLVVEAVDKEKYDEIIVDDKYVTKTFVPNLKDETKMQDEYKQDFFLDDQKKAIWSKTSYGKMGFSLEHSLMCLYVRIKMIMVEI
jgi:hypothetical protein